jgi:hypothetical protein
MMQSAQDRQAGRPTLSRDSARRRHNLTACPRRPSSPLLQNLIFGTHRDEFTWHSPFAAILSKLDRDLRAYFDHSSGWNLEMIGCVVGDTSEHDEQAVLPARHARTRRRFESTARQEK